MPYSGSRVYCRFRPTDNPTSLVQVSDDHVSVHVDRRGASGNVLRNATEDYTFRLDSVLTNASQEEVFDACMTPLLEAVFNGCNATLICCGQRGSGKSFTVFGEGDFHQRGCAPRSLQAVFDHISKTSRDAEYEVHVRGVEVYGNNIRDLLEPPERQTAAASSASVSSPYGGPPNAAHKRGVTVRLTVRSGVTVENVCERRCNSEVEVLTSLFECLANRFEGASFLGRGPASNLDGVAPARGPGARLADGLQSEPVTPQGHVVFTVIITQRMRYGRHEQVPVVSKLQFVDLTGSRGVGAATGSATAASGAFEGFIEDRTYLHVAKQVNKSLSLLSQVIQELGSAVPERLTHVPHRQSRLAMLLRDAIGGRSCVATVANIIPEQHCLSEALSTLSFAQGLSKVKCRTGRGGDGVLSGDLSAQLSRLHAAISAPRPGIGAGKVLASQGGELHGEAQTPSGNSSAVGARGDDMWSTRPHLAAPEKSRYATEEGPVHLAATFGILNVHQRHLPWRSASAQQIEGQFSGVGVVANGAYGRPDSSSSFGNRRQSYTVAGPNFAPSSPPLSARSGIWMNMGVGPLPGDAGPQKYLQSQLHPRWLPAPTVAARDSRPHGLVVHGVPGAVAGALDRSHTAMRGPSVVVSAPDDLGLAEHRRNSTYSVSRRRSLRQYLSELHVVEDSAHGARAVPSQVRIFSGASGQPTSASLSVAAPQRMIGSPTKGHLGRGNTKNRKTGAAATDVTAATLAVHADGSQDVVLTGEVVRPFGVGSGNGVPHPHIDDFLRPIQVNAPTHSESTHAANGNASAGNEHRPRGGVPIVPIEARRSYEALIASTKAIGLELNDINPNEPSLSLMVGCALKPGPLYSVPPPPPCTGVVSGQPSTGEDGGERIHGASDKAKAFVPLAHAFDERDEAPLNEDGGDDAVQGTFEAAVPTGKEKSASGRLRVRNIRKGKVDRGKPRSERLLTAVPNDAGEEVIADSDNVIGSVAAALTAAGNADGHEEVQQLGSVCPMAPEMELCDGDQSLCRSTKSLMFDEFLRSPEGAFLLCEVLAQGEALIEVKEQILALQLQMEALQVKETECRQQYMTVVREREQQEYRRLPATVVDEESCSEGSRRTRAARTMSSVAGLRPRTATPASSARGATKCALRHRSAQAISRGAYQPQPPSSPLQLVDGVASVNTDLAATVGTGLRSLRATTSAPPIVELLRSEWERSKRDVADAYSSMSAMLAERKNIVSLLEKKQGHLLNSFESWFSIAVPREALLFPSEGAAARPGCASQAQCESQRPSSSPAGGPHSRGQRAPTYVRRRVPATWGPYNSSEENGEAALLLGSLGLALTDDGTDRFTALLTQRWLLSAPGSVPFYTAQRLAKHLHDTRARGGKGVARTRFS